MEDTGWKSGAYIAAFLQPTYLDFFPAVSLYGEFLYKLKVEKKKTKPICTC